eukprot:jgi/Orpsp1_1/1179371/evm.model.c7180000069031.1
MYMIVGCLLYFIMGTHPSIMFATSKPSRKSKNPTYKDWYDALKIFRYLKIVKNYGIKFINNINLKILTDTDLGGDEITKRITTGFIILMEQTPITWCSKLQNYVIASITENKYYDNSEYTSQ